MNEIFANGLNVFVDLYRRLFQLMNFVFDYEQFVQWFDKRLKNSLVMVL